MREGVIKRYMMDLGTAIDSIAKKHGGLTTMEITATMARLLASAAMMVDPQNKGGGAEFATKEYMNALRAQCLKHGVKDVQVMEMYNPQGQPPPPAKPSGPAN